MPSQSRLDFPLPRPTTPVAEVETCSSDGDTVPASESEAGCDQAINGSFDSGYGGSIVDGPDEGQFRRPLRMPLTLTPRRLTSQAFGGRRIHSTVRQILSLQAEDLRTLVRQ